MPDLLTAAGLTRDDIERLIASARDYRAGRGRRWPQAVGLMFYEDSLRTRVGFEVAAARLGARTTVVLEPRRSEAMWAPESTADAVRSIAGWCDALCLRHPDAVALAGLTDTPVVNCGDGGGEHPTQALVDVFAMHELLGGIDGAHIALVGDLHAMRTAHSLAYLLARFDAIDVRCVGPAGLDLPAPCLAALRDGGAEVTSVATMDVDGVDVVYVAGLPAQTRAGVLTREEQAVFHVTSEVVGRMKPKARVLCPLPRMDEIAPEVDTLAAAAYFAQSELGQWMRMAVLDLVLADG
jgi:aspartate carbamoyltransferase catalytic subunit